MKLTECKGHWALITGASSGLGREFAIQLAAIGLNLILVARRKALLDALAADLSHRHGTRVLVSPVDLAQPDAVPAIRSRLAAEGVRVRLLCNNAAFGRWGRFEETPADIYQQMLQVNISAMVALCHHFLPDLASFPTSAIINVSSPAALQPVPYMAVYAATKSFVDNFSQALYGEWMNRGILVQTLLPGPTATEFDTIAGAYETVLKARGKPEQVVRDSLAHLEKSTPIVKSASGTYKQRLFSAVFPAKMVIATVARMFQPPPVDKP